MLVGSARVWVMRSPPRSLDLPDTPNCPEQGHRSELRCLARGEAVVPAAPGDGEPPVIDCRVEAVRPPSDGINARPQPRKSPDIVRCFPSAAWWTSIKPSISSGDSDRTPL